MNIDSESHSDNSGKELDSEAKPPLQVNKCLNEKRRREQENIYIEELAELICVVSPDISTNKPDKCAILQETVNQIRKIEEQEPIELQQSVVSSSIPSLIGDDVLGPLFLEALDGVLFVVDKEGKIEFVSENIFSFLHYTQDDLQGKNIFDIIDSSDDENFRNHFSLISSSPPSVPTTVPSPSSSGSSNTSKKSVVTCHMMIKGDPLIDDNSSQYQNVQISLFVPPNREKAVNIQNRLVCVARRIPVNEKGPTSISVEQFTTRLDPQGKIIAIDTRAFSGASSIYTQYLSKDLVGQLIQDLCLPADLPKLSQHIEQTLQTGSNTSEVYKLRLVQDKFLSVQTKSKHFIQEQTSNDKQFIMATHSIIKDPETIALMEEASSLVKSSPSPSRESQLITATFNSGAFYPSLGSPSNEFDLSLELAFPNSNWDLDSTSSRGTPINGDNGLLAPSGASTSNRSSTSFSSAFSLPDNKTLLSLPNPPQQQLDNSFSSLAVSATTTSANEASLLSVSSDSVTLMNQGARIKQTPQRLRNLLTQNLDTPVVSISSNLSLNIPKQPDSETAAVASSSSSNIILRELLNQDDEELGSDKGGSSSLLYGGQGKLGASCSPDVAKRKPLNNNNNNNMLRKLLNNEEDGERHFKKDPDFLLQQLLKPSSPEKREASMSIMSKSDLLLKQMGFEGTSSSTTSTPSPTIDVARFKRKSAEDSTTVSPTSTKRPNLAVPSPATTTSNNNNIHHAHLAGQNPMLASMLAQTPRTPPSVPTSVANSIMSQLPQDRLPKNLEKKLIHTPGPIARPQDMALDPGTIAQLQQHQQGFKYEGDQVVHSLEDRSIQGEDVNCPNSDPLLSDILDQVWSLQQELNVSASSSSDDATLMKILDEVLDSSSNSVQPAAVSMAPCDINEKLAISAIQKQLMSFDPQSNNSNYGSNAQQTMLARTLVNSGAASGYRIRPSATNNHQAQLLLQQTANLQIKRQLMELKKSCIEQKRQMSFQNQAAVAVEKPQPVASTSSSNFSETINELLSHEVPPPNVSLQRTGDNRFPASQLSPGSQPSYPSPSNYGGKTPSSRLSPHLLPGYSQAASPGPPHSPHPSPQAPNTVTWPPSPTLQQQNPMLNAQLSQGTFVANQPRPQPQQILRTVTSLSGPSSSHTSVFTANQATSAATVTYQQQTQRVRKPSLSGTSSKTHGYSDASSYSQSAPSAFPSTSTHPEAARFNFEPQSLQIFSSNDRNRPSSSGASEYVRQELRAVVGARTQQLSLVSTSQQFSPEDLEALGLSYEIGPSEAQPTSPGVFSQSLLNIAGDNSPNHRARTTRALEESKPLEPKKSLLQQLLSEPP